MTRLWYCLTLTSDVSFSASNSTVQARTLTYVPGAALLGAAARTCYPSNDATRAFALFHSGALRFGNAVPVSNGAMLVTSPKVLYKPKRSGEGDALEQSGAYVNALRHEPTVQPESLKGGYLLARSVVKAGGPVWTSSPATRIALRTAIDRDTGRADAGKLYQMECLREGQRFIGYIAGPEADVISAWEALCGGVRIGRSRGVELGSASLVRIDGPDGPGHGKPAPDEATLHCLSDLALVDAAGHPRLRPEPSDFGLAAGTFDAERSAIRTRRYSPYNAHRKRFDSERQVIEAGSVIHFKDTGRIDDAAVVRALAAGVGLHTGEGLGELVFEPEFLRGQTLSAWTPWVTAPAEADASSAHPNTTLVDWLLKRSAEKTNEQALFDAAKADAARFKGVPPSQWGALPGLVTDDGELSHLRDFLAKGVRKRIWQYRWDALEKLLQATAAPERRHYLTLLGLHARAENAASDERNNKTSGGVQ